MCNFGMMGVVESQRGLVGYDRRGPHKLLWVKNEVGKTRPFARLKREKEMLERDPGTASMKSISHGRYHRGEANITSTIN